LCETKQFYVQYGTTTIKSYRNATAEIYTKSYLHIYGNAIT